MSAAMNTFLMAIGSLTIVCAVMMALVQHDLKRLLGYHAVSQVGYMVLGIGTGNPIGIAGGIFHMLNHAIYKSCLFLSAGAVEKKTGTTDLDKLGGLSKTMPVVYVAFLIASLAISGVPPLNGFASKWMIYQGIIETGRQGSHLWILWLMAAMFGSALTLASFMKLVHAVFLGQPSSERPPLTAEQRQNAYDHVVSDCFIGGPLCSLRSFCQANSFRALCSAEFKAERGFLGDMECGCGHCFNFFGYTCRICDLSFGHGRKVKDNGPICRRRRPQGIS